MSYSGEGVQPRTISLLPNGSTQWVIQEIPSLDGTIVHAPNCDPDIVSRITQPYQRDTRTSLKWLGVGNFATVQGDGIVAYKFFDQDNDFAEESRLDALSLGNLAANLALHKGLEGQRPIRSGLRRKITLAAPAIHAAFFPREQPCTINQPYTVWAMDQAAGVKVQDFEDLPHPLNNEVFIDQVIKKAVALSGIMPETLDNDLTPENMLLSKANKLSILDIMLGEASGRILTEQILESAK